MKLLILSFCCLVLVCLNGVASQRVEDGGWIEDTDAVADELDSIFGEEESDEEKPRIYLGGLVGGGTSIRTNIFTPSVTNDCICPTGSECECCTSDEVNSKTITGCVTVSKAEVPGTVNAVFYFNGLRVSKSIFSVKNNEENCREVLTPSEIMTLCINSYATEDGGICMTTSFKTFDSTTELKYKCIKMNDGVLSINKV